MKKPITVAVVGAGASGLVAAIAAARKGAKVTLFDGNDKLGKKIYATGNGKCNFTNALMDSRWYYTSDQNFVEDTLRQFGAPESLAFFASLGMLSYEKDGYYYPASQQAATVVELLTLELKRLQVSACLEERVLEISKEGKNQEQESGFTIKTEKQTRFFQKVILACGGKAMPNSGSDGYGYHLAKSLGHSCISPQPALTALKCKEKNWNLLTGVRTKATLTLYIDKQKSADETGELQLTDYGISGIVVFQFSRLAACALAQGKRVTVRIDLFSQYSKEAYTKMVKQRMEQFSDRTLEAFFLGMLHKKILGFFLKREALSPELIVSKCPKEKIESLFQLFRNWEVTITATNSFENAQVTAGGVPLCEITPEMESRKCAGLFITGELLDVDGKCGGYNLQWAWSTGFIAGSACAKESVGEQYDTD